MSSLVWAASAIFVGLFTTVSLAVYSGRIFSIEGFIGIFIAIFSWLAALAFVKEYFKQEDKK